MSKLFNRHTVKVSYRCGPNFETLIRGHNSKLLKKSRSKNSDSERDCDCSKNSVCPVDGKCLQKNVIYTALVVEDNNNDKAKQYVGLSSTSFKLRYTNHKSDINNRDRDGTELSDYVWKLKDNNSNYTIRWSILSKESYYNTETEKCYLCTSEKLQIFDLERDTALNSRSDIFNICIHRWRNMLGNFKPKRRLNPEVRIEEPPPDPCDPTSEPDPEEIIQAENFQPSGRLQPPIRNGNLNILTISRTPGRLRNGKMRR